MLRSLLENLGLNSVTTELELIPKNGNRLSKPTSPQTASVVDRDADQALGALNTSYFTSLVAAHTELGSSFNLAQFGIYTTA